MLQKDAMKKTRLTYTGEFKLEAVKMMTEQGSSARDVEESLGIGHGMLYRWKAQLAAEGQSAFPGNGSTGALEAEVRELRQELKRARQERDDSRKRRPTSRESRAEIQLRS